MSPNGRGDAFVRNIDPDDHAVALVVAEISNLPVEDDGVRFLTETIAIRSIRELANQPGWRLTMEARIGRASVPFRLDISFDSAISTQSLPVAIPPLLPKMPPVEVLGYPISFVIAEKLATAIQLGEANTRVKDYVDIYMLISSRDMRHQELHHALRETLLIRGIDMQPLHTRVGELGMLRHDAYRQYLRTAGLFDRELPSEFPIVVAAVVVFSDSLIVDKELVAWWHASSMRWQPNQPQVLD